MSEMFGKKSNINLELQSQIMAMVEADQKMRSSGEWDEAVDQQNTEKLKKIITK